MERGESIGKRRTQQQNSVPGHAEREEEEGFTSTRQEDSTNGAGDPKFPGRGEYNVYILVSSRGSMHATNDQN